MNIGLLTDNFSVENGTGIAKYSGELFNGLVKRRISTILITAPQPKIPLGTRWGHIFIQPYYTYKEKNEFDFVHATAPLNALSFPLIRKPKIVTYHDMVSILCNDSGASSHTKVSSPYLYKKIASKCDRIIADSTQTKNELIQYLKIPEEKITVINLGVDERFQPLKKEETNCYYIGYLGSLMKRKRVDRLIRAFYHLNRNHPDLKTRLVICGSKRHEYSKLLELVNQLGLTKIVVFKGFVSDDQLVQSYNSFDVFVLPSDWEGFGIPILEAQRSGVPVVIMKNSHIPEETSRYCMKAESEEDMAEKIFQLITNKDLRAEIIKNGFEYSKGFTWDKTVDQTLKVYEDVTSVNKE